jgi:hypothetical protein
MSNTNKTVRGDKPLGKPRSVSQAPPPTDPISGRGRYMPPQPDAPSPETRRKIHEAQMQLDQAIADCGWIIKWGRDTRGVDYERWAYEAGRWSILRPAADRALAECKNVGMAAPELATLRNKLKRLDEEWVLVTQYRNKISTTQPDITPADARKRARRPRTDRATTQKIKMDAAIQTRWGSAVPFLTGSISELADQLLDALQHMAEPIPGKRTVERHLSKLRRPPRQ